LGWRVGSGATGAPGAPGSKLGMELSMGICHGNNPIHMKIIGANYIYWYSIGYPIDIEYIIY
jgi:hypothetical protein